MEYNGYHPGANKDNSFESKRPIMEDQGDRSALCTQSSDINESLVMV